MQLPAKYYLGDGRHAEGIHIANGQMLNTKHINKFGYNGAVGSTFELIGVSSANIVYPTVAGYVSIVSTELDDDGTDLDMEGAYTVKIDGLDGDYNEQSVTLTLNGTTAVTTQGMGPDGADITFLRVFRMSVETSFDENGAVGVITAGIYRVSDTTLLTQATINPAYDNQTLQAAYTVPAGKTAYMIRMQATATKDNKAGMVAIHTREYDDVPSTATKPWKVKQIAEVFQNNVTVEFPVPLLIPEKTDIELRGKCLSLNTMGMGGTYDLLLVDNPS